MFAKRTAIKKIKIPCNYENLNSSQKYEVRQEYIKKQGGMCWYCENGLDQEPWQDIAEMEVDSDLFPEGFFKHPIHLHHDHNTGMTIGAVHSHCNAVLWQYKGE